MNKELERKLMAKPTLLGYKSLVKAIMKCDDEVIEKITKEYNNVISGLD